MSQTNMPKEKVVASSPPPKSVLDEIALFQGRTEEEKADKYVNSQYLCKKKLGSGGFGEVWSCWDLLGLADSEKRDVEAHTFAMKIENLQDVESKDKDKDKNGKDRDQAVKKVPVPMNQSQLLYE